jgi:hypothetical protein
MKKLTILILTFMSFGLSAQSANTDYSIVVAEVDIMKLDEVEYIELLGFQKILSFDINIVVDYGQKTQFLGKPQTIRDESKGFYANGTGMNKDFHSMVDALNFFNSRGWEYVNQYVVTIGTQNVYHILLRRKH